MPGSADVLGFGRNAITGVSGESLAESAAVIRTSDPANLTLDANSELNLTALSSWTKSPAGLTVAGGQADPDGGTGAFKLTDSSDGSAVDHTLSLVVGVSANLQYRYTVRAKADTGFAMTIRADNGAARFYVNLSTGGSYQVEAFNSKIRGWVEPDTGVNGTGWYKITLEFKRPTGQNVYLGLHTPAAGVDYFNDTYQGGANKSIYLFQPSIKLLGATCSAQAAGGGNSAVQGTAAQRPMAHAERAWSGGETALCWPGDVARSLTLHALASTWDAAQPFTLVWVGQPGVQSADAALLTLSHSSGTGVFKPLIFTAAGTITTSRTTNANVTTTGTLHTARPKGRCVMALTYDGTNAQLYVDGIPLGTPVALGGGAASFDQLTFGATGLVVRERDCRMFARTLTPTEVASTSRYLAAIHSSVTQPWQIWLLAGQSNAVGYVSIGAAAASGYQWQTDGLLWARMGDPAYTNYPWDLPHDIVGSSGTSAPSWIGPEAGFLKTMNPSGRERVAVLKYAVNATSLGGNNAGVWNKAAGQLYTKWQTAVSDGLAAIAMPYQIAGLLWMQGEQDAADATGVNGNAYQANLTQFLVDARADFGLQHVVIGLINSHIDTGVFPYLTTVRAAQAAVCAADPFAYLVTADALALQPDSLHYTGGGQSRLGVAFAAAAAGHIDVVAS